MADIISPKVICHIQEVTHNIKELKGIMYNYAFKNQRNEKSNVMPLMHMTLNDFPGFI